MHSPRGLTQGAAHVTLQPQPEAVLQRHPLHAHMRRLQALNVPRAAFWDTTSKHLVEVQVTLPCEAQLRVGGRTLQARSSPTAGCSEACAVMQLAVVESWDTNLASAWAIESGTVYLKDGMGLSQDSLASAAVLQLLQWRQDDAGH